MEKSKSWNHLEIILGEKPMEKMVSPRLDAFSTNKKLKESSSEIPISAAQAVCGCLQGRTPPVFVAVRFRSNTIDIINIKAVKVRDRAKPHHHFP